MKFSTYSFKQLLSGGLLCCLILLAAYIFQAFFPGVYVDAFSSSMHLLMWLTLFVGAQSAYLHWQPTNLVYLH